MGRVCGLGVNWLYKQIVILYISLSLLSVSEAPKVAPVAKKFPSYNPHFKTEEEKKEEVPETQCLYQYL